MESVILKNIGTADTEYAFVEWLMAESFPEEERRAAAVQREFVDTEQRMHCCVICDSETPVGLLTYWDFGDYMYIEHFAIDPALRGHGYGSRAIECFKCCICGDVPFVLEVECPDDPIARRRIEFYRRCGLELWPDLGYIQPAYRLGGATLPMRLMAAPALTADSYPRLRTDLRTHVYRYR